MSNNNIKCCFVIPYFGKLPNYFPLFLKSCEYNPEYNWLLFTDDKTEYNYPSNFKCVYMEFSDLRNIVQSKFDFPICLDRPYKLCDYKPAYGYIFEDYLREYKCWGHCDIDIVLGKITDFVSDEMLDFYDKLFCLGHFIIYKNTFENNRLFMTQYNNAKLYKSVFTTPKILVFDEELRNNNNVNQLFLHSGKKVFQEDLSLNICIFYKKFLRVQFCGVEHGYRNAYLVETPRKSITIWDKGKICRYCNEGDKLIREEYLYIHLQKRSMSFDNTVLDSNLIHILPNAFRIVKALPKTLDDLKSWKQETICFHRTRLILNGYKKRLINKLKRLF